MMSLYFQKVGILFFIFHFVDLASADCWWTGCQPNSWMVKGCGQYNRIEKETKYCKDGLEYYCCEEESISPIKASVPDIPVSASGGCWWTGCQPNSWKVKGCGQYNRIQKDTKLCKDGLEYYCCEEESIPPIKVTSTSTLRPSVPDSQLPVSGSGCWWTGCQSSDWAVVGCGQYNLTQKDVKVCDGGHEFHCCPPAKTSQNKLHSFCVWSECQPANTTKRNCPSHMKQVSAEPCDEGGEIIQCCGDKPKRNDVNSLTGESFTNLVKSLLLKGKNFTIEPDSLPCRAIDVQKRALLKIKNEGIYVCDLCPFFPQKRFVNVFLSNEPSEIEYNLKFEECFGYCFNKNNCVAFSYDLSEHRCYIFDNTVGNLIQGPQWTTVFMTQPVGMLQDWTYARHTTISGNKLQTTKSNSFLSCLSECSRDKNCNFVSYSIQTKDCSAFSTQDEISYVDLKYGHVSAFKMSSLLDTDATSRFIEIGDDVFAGSKSSKTNGCAKGSNATHSAFFSKSCLTTPGVGCDAGTGCRKCYYPEKTQQFSNLVICPDSDWVIYNEIKKNIRKSLSSCLKNSACIAVGYNSKTKITKQLTFDTFSSVEFSTIFIMRYPMSNFDNHKTMTKYEFLLNHDIKKIGQKTNGFQQTRVKSFKECLNLFESNSFIRMSYANGVCKVSTEEVEFVSTAGQHLTVFKKPSITSPVLNYARAPGVSVDKSKAKGKRDSCQNCEIVCAEDCNTKYAGWCSHFTIEQSADKASCLFFDFFKDSEVKSVVIKKQGNAQLFTKLSTLDFTLKSLNKLSPFQRSDIYNCFQPDSDNRQTSTSLTKYDWKNGKNTALQLRTKRFDLFGLIGKGLKAVGEFVVDTAKDVVEGVVETGKAVANTVVGLAQGDLDKAKESFFDIPIVQDAKNAVELGQAVVSGDWDQVKEKGLDLLQGQALDIGLSMIPIVGKFAGKGVKGLAKVAKKMNGKGPKKGAKGKTDKLNDKSRKGTEDNKGKDKNRNNCKRRTKRATGQNQPGMCDDDDDDAKCPIVRISNVLSLSKCTKRNKNSVCKYECEPGYDEPNKEVKCLGLGNNRLDWTPNPTCSKISCSRSNRQVIVLRTPHVSDFQMAGTGHFITLYVIAYHKKRKLPDWSIALHQSEQYGVGNKNYNALRNVVRNNEFEKFPCNELMNHQAHTNDYTGTGWDRGHLTPFNIARWSLKSKLSSNLMINVAPQDPTTNRQPWQWVEKAVECFSKKKRSVVVTGVCTPSIGKLPSGLDIPACFWKMVCYKDEAGNEQVVGFMALNSHPKDEDDRNNRRADVLTPRSQEQINRLFQGNPWIAANKINAGRPVIGGDGDFDWFPVNLADCKAAKWLPDEEKIAWENGLPPKRKLVDLTGGPSKKKKGNKSKRAADSAIIRGCHGAEKTIFESLVGSESGGDSEEGSQQPVGDTLVSVQKCNKRIVGYYTSWGDKQISGQEIQRLTHIVYAFLEMKEDGSIQVGSADRKNAEDVDEETRKSEERLTDLMELAGDYPHVKVLFAVGGWENSQYFSAVAASPQKRITFIASIVQMIQEYGFDGVDIDWEYPVTGGANEGIPQDKQNYVNLMKEIRISLDGLAVEAGREEKFLLSFAGAAGQWTLEPGFDLPGLLEHADFVNIMSYDFFGAWSSKWGAYTGPPAPLYFGMPARFSGKTNADWTVKYYTCKTKMPHKINMGVPFYGRYWKNVGPPVDDKDGMWRTAERVNGKFDGGYKPWNEIPEYLSEGGFKEFFHEKSQTPYAWSESTKTFLGYENKKSLESKVAYAVEKNVGGLMIWSVEQDDDDLTLLDTVYKAELCGKTDPDEINHKCSPIDEKRWWTSEDGDDMAGLCGRSAPLYKGYYPVCDPDDPGYSCCGPAGYCGSGPKYCDCPTCKNYGDDPRKILEEPVKPSVPVTWYFLNAAEGKRGRCGRQTPKINGVFPTCNPDDDNSYCCSNGGYCGSKPEFCQCNGCVNFKKNKNYRYGPKKWWSVSDGEELQGKCGPKVPKVDGIYEAECEPNTKFSCCSANGYCGSGPEFCDCKGCRKFT